MAGDLLFYLTINSSFMVITFSKRYFLYCKKYPGTREEKKYIDAKIIATSADIFSEKTKKLRFFIYTYSYLSGSEYWQD